MVTHSHDGKAVPFTYGRDPPMRESITAQSQRPDLDTGRTGIGASLVDPMNV